MELIAIQTPHYAHNYGAQLQAFALAEAVRTLGYDVEYINRRPDTYACKSNSLRDLIRKAELQTHLAGFVQFEENYLQPQTPPIYNNTEYNKYDYSKYKAVIVGSDQIWRDSFFFSSFEYSPYLYFIKDESVRKISYAASFGKNTCVHPEERRKEISKLLKLFSNISVREESGIEILHNIYGVKGKWVADPTLLHTAALYRQKFSLSPVPGLCNTLSTYILGTDTKCVKKCKQIANTLECDCFNIYKPTLFDKIRNHKYLYLLPDFKRIPSVLDWLNTIMSSKFILTDSFHGMAFCILFKKQFVVLNRIDGGTERYISLLNLLGIPERLCEWNTDSAQIIKLLNREIDYQSVYKRLQLFRDESMTYLKTSLM